MPPVAESPRVKALKLAPLDSWVVLSADETTILTTGASFQEASANAEALGAPEDSVVIKTPKRWAPLSV